METYRVVSYETFLKHEPHALDEKDPRSQGPWCGAKAVLDALPVLVEAMAVTEPSVASKLHVGCVKDTKLYGTTSVSMGVAARFFANQEQNKVLIVNVGSGGAKASVYVRDSDGVRSAVDVKPRESAPNIGHLREQEVDPAASEREGKNLESFVAQLKEVCDAQTKAIVFATGEIRTAYFTQPHRRAELAQRLVAFFKPLSDVWPLELGGNLRFLNQKDEAQLEFLAVETMYGNIQKAGKLDPKFAPVASFGMGNESTQIGANFGELLVVCGMKKLVAQQGDARFTTFTQMLRDHTDFRVFAAALAQELARLHAEGKQPTICLKSGALLNFNPDSL